MSSLINYSQYNYPLFSALEAHSNRTADWTAEMRLQSIKYIIFVAAIRYRYSQWCQYEYIDALYSYKLLLFFLKKQFIIKFIQSLRIESFALADVSAESSRLQFLCFIFFCFFFNHKPMWSITYMKHFHSNHLQFRTGQTGYVWMKCSFKFNAHAV